MTGGAEVLQTESSTVATTIVGRQIGELPFSTRDALQLVLTLPGVMTPGTPRTSSINGLPKGSVNLTLDGANIQDNFLRSSDGFFTSIQAKSDAVQEVTVTTATPGAESGGEGAVQIRFITKSGSPEYHGAASGSTARRLSTRITTSTISMVFLATLLFSAVGWKPWRADNHPGVC